GLHLVEEQPCALPAPAGLQQLRAGGCGGDLGLDATPAPVETLDLVAEQAGPGGKLSDLCVELGHTPGPLPLLGGCADEPRRLRRAATGEGAEAEAAIPAH